MIVKKNRISSKALVAGHIFGVNNSVNVLNSTSKYTLTYCAVAPISFFKKDNCAKDNDEKTTKNIEKVQK